MRDLVFRNLTSFEKKRRIVASSEVIDNNGIHSVIHRHFMYMVREVSSGQMPKIDPYVKVIKQRNSVTQQEHFFCKIKGSVYAMHQEKVFLVVYMHTLRIGLSTLPQAAPGGSCT